MNMNLIKTSLLIKELMSRAADQMHDPEPQFDGVFSFLTPDELDTFMDEMHQVLKLQEERWKLGRR